MGQLIEMPVANIGENEKPSAAPLTVAPETDFTPWKNAPRERTAAYFPAYSTVSKAIQRTLREWVREWLSGNVEILLRPHHAYALLVYQCTHPFAGRPTNVFTYEIQRTEVLKRAFRSAASRLGKHLKTLDTGRLSWFTREHYFAYRSKEVVKYVERNPRALYRMLHVETMLMDAILRFSIVDVPAEGMGPALARLRRTFGIQLRRFSGEFDLSLRSEELLAIATKALVEKMSADNVEPIAA